MATISEYPEDDANQFTDGGEWEESDVVCEHCGRLMWQAEWWDDPPEIGGANIGWRYKCGTCGHYEER